MLHQNQDLSLENEKLRGELDRLEAFYGSRITELEAELAEERKERD